MKKFLAIALLISGLIGSQAHAKMYYVTNATPFTATVYVRWSACSADTRTVNAGETIGIDGKACLMTRFGADVHVTTSPTLSGVSYQATLLTGTPVKIGAVEASAYTSSGQATYDHFFIVGPINSAPTFRVGRLVQ